MTSRSVKADRATDGLGPVNPVVVRSASAQVADQIVLAMREGRVQLNDRLPPERELAKRFRVSRPTIREALAALELAGMVESRQGSGTIVVATSARVAGWGKQILPPQVFEARLVIEPQLAALAAEKRYPEDVTALRETLHRLEAEFDRTSSYESDLPLHHAVARAARNPILQQAMEEALAYTRDELWVDLRRRALVAYEARQGHVQEWREIVDFITEGKPDEAASVWRRHLVFYRDEMLGRA